MTPSAPAPPSPELAPDRAPLSPAAKAAWWLLPTVFLVWLYRDAFSTWFFLDDFAWLSLGRLARIRHDLLHELFSPMAQGTIRPWSERGYFMLLQYLVGLDSLPFRLVTFATAAADLLLIAWITLRATRSRIAGFLAPILWTANAALVFPLAWSSAYNEVMCPLFLLGALALFIRYLETGRRSFWWWQLVVFGLGFGALEIEVVYPVLAAAWVLFAANFTRSNSPLPSVSTIGAARVPRDGARLPGFDTLALPSVIPQALISAAYFALHRFLAPIPSSGPYTLHFDFSILTTLALYWKWAFIPEAIDRFGHSHHLSGPILLLCTAAVISFVALELSRRRYLVLFYLAWAAATLAPMLPFTEHHTDYYITIPFIGIAMLGGTAVGEYWTGSIARRALVLLPIAAYLWVMIPVAKASTRWWVVRSGTVRTLVLGVIAAHETHPGKAIALDAVTPELFELALAHSPFPALAINDVYLTPEAALTLPLASGNPDLRDLVLGPEVMWHAITHDDVVVYSFASDRLRNITEGYTRRMLGRSVDRLPSQLDIGNSLYSWLLGPTWLPPESGIRWMPGSATVRIGVPPAGSQLEIDGRCPEAQLLLASRHLMVLVDGVVVGDTRIYDPESNFHRLFQMPAVLAGKKSVEIEIRVDPVDRKDDQDYGLVFGNIAIRP